MHSIGDKLNACGKAQKATERAERRTRTNSLEFEVYLKVSDDHLVFVGARWPDAVTPQVRGCVRDAVDSAVVTSHIADTAPFTYPMCIHP